MAVPPGFSGQKYINSTTEKIRELRNIDKQIEIVVDGGMNEKTMLEVTSSGADSCVVCSVIVKSEDIRKKTILLKQMCKKGQKIFLGELMTQSRLSHRLGRACAGGPSLETNISHLSLEKTNSDSRRRSSR